MPSQGDREYWDGWRRRWTLLKENMLGDRQGGEFYQEMKKKKEKQCSTLTWDVRSPPFTSKEEDFTIQSRNCVISISLMSLSYIPKE